MEYVKPTFLDERLVPAHNNHRVDIHGERWYVRVYEDGSTSKMAPSWTTVKNKCAATDPGLLMWKTANSKEYTDFVSINSAHYGTFFHVMCGRYLSGETLMLNEGWLSEEMAIFSIAEDYSYEDCRQWMRNEKRDLRKDLYGFSVFCKTWQVKPLAIEYPVMNVDGLYAATIDIVAEITDPKTEVTCIAIIDIKSTLKGVDRPDNELQLFAQWIEWNSEWLEFPAMKIFNYGCHNYRLPLSSKVIPYKLKDHSTVPNAFKWPLWLELFHSDQKNKPSKKKTDFKENVGICIAADNDEVFDTYDILGRVIDFDKEAF